MIVVVDSMCYFFSLRHKHLFLINECFAFVSRYLSFRLNISEEPSRIPKDSKIILKVLIRKMENERNNNCMRISEGFAGTKKIFNLKMILESVKEKGKKTVINLPGRTDNFLPFFSLHSHFSNFSL